jgi:AsmA protein
MNKVLKFLGITLAVIVGLLVIAVVALTLVFDPNKYKDDIIRLVKDQTGRDLRIEKKIGWSFFPRLGIEAGGLELADAPGFGKDPFARIDAAGVHVAFLPLLTGRIDVDSVYLHGLTLNLAKDAGGRSNWDDLTARTAAPARAKPEKEAPTRLPVEGLAVGKLDIRRANLNWRDAQAGSTLAVKNLELATGRFVANQPMDLRLAFELARDRAAPVKTALKSRLTASIDALKLANLDLKVDDSRLTGSVEVRNLTNPAVRFDLELDKIDLDRYLAAADAKTQPATSQPGKPAAAGNAAPLALLRNLDVQGKFGVRELKVLGLRASEARVQAHAKGGVLRLGPNTAKLYSGSYRGETTVDARGKTVQLKFDETLEGVQAGPLLKDMKLFDSYTGTGNIAVKLTAAGLDAAQIRRTLNGNASIAFRDGRIDGIDLEALYKTVMEKSTSIDTLFKLIPKPGDSTRFGEMSGTFQVANGVAATRDLKIRMSTLLATGQGSEDLARETNNLRIDLVEQKNLGQKCKSLPFRIRGSFNKPEVTLDDDFFKCKLQKAAEKELGKGLEKLLQPKKRK